MRLGSYLIICLLLFSTALSATAGEAPAATDYTDRGVAIQLDGAETMVITRRASFSDDAELVDLKVLRAGTVIQQAVSIEGVVRNGNVSTSYRGPVPTATLPQANAYLDAGSASYDTSAYFNYYLPHASAIPPGLLNDFTDVYKAQQAMQDAARAWTANHNFEIVRRNGVLRATENMVREFSAAVDSSLVESSIAAFSDPSRANLLDAQANLSLSVALAAPDAQTKWIAISPERQTKILDKLLSDEHGIDASAVARAISDLSSPLNTSTTQTSKVRMTEAGVKNGVMPGSVVSATNSIQFKSPDLEDARIRTQNSLQAAGAMFPNVMAAQGMDYARAAEFYLAAAQKSEAHGDLPGARQFTAKALEIANALSAQGDGSGLALDQSGGLKAYGDAISAFQKGGVSPLALNSTSQDFRDLADPLGAILGEHLNSEDPEVSLAARNGLQLLARADQASVAGQTQISSTMVQVVIGIVDVTVAFVPPISICKDSYELVLGKHWITGNELSPFERGVAAAGVMSFGISSGAARGVQNVLPLLREMGITEQVLGIGSSLSKSLKTAGITSVETYSGVRESVLAAKSLGAASNVILDTTRPFTERVAKLGYNFQVMSLEFNDKLNTAIQALGLKPYYLKGGISADVFMNTAPSDLIRIFKQGSTSPNGSYLIQQSLLEELAKRNPTENALSAALKNELNLPYLPDSFVKLAKKSEGFEVRISEIGNIPEFGTRQGQLQFEALEHLNRSDFSDEVYKLLDILK